MSGPSSEKQTEKEKVNEIKVLKNGKSAHKSRLLAAMIALSLCSSWTYSPAHAAIITVPAGETATGVILGSYDVQYVYGTANGTVASQFNSGQIVYDAGVINNTILNTGGYQWVYNSGVANYTQVYGTANQTLADNSTANHTTLNDSSEQDVCGNGIANDTTLNNQAKQYIGGTAINSTVTDITGTANNTTLNDSAMQYVLYNGNRANHTILNGSSIQGVYNSAIATDTVLNNNAQQVIYNSGTASNTTLNDSSKQIFYNNGIATDTVLNNNAQQYVYNTSMANDTTLNGSSIQAVDDTGVATDTALNNSAKQYVLGNGTASDTVLNDTAQQVIYNSGTANHTTLNDSSMQALVSTGVANDTVLNNTAQQYVYTTSTANNTTLYGSAVQLVDDNGTANGTVLNESAQQTVYVNGAVHSTVLNNNTEQWLNDSSTAYDAVLNDNAVQNIYGNATVNNTVLNDSAAQWVHETGKANDTTLNNMAVQYVYGSGTVNGTILNNSARQWVYEASTANDTVLNNSAVQRVLGTGAANSTVLYDSALQEVYGSGVANNTTLNNNAVQLVFETGTAKDTVLRGGSLQRVYGDGKVYRTEVNDQAAMVVESGATAYDTTVNSGSLYIGQNSILKNDETDFGAAVKINSGGTLAVAENGADIDGNVALQGGTIAFMRQGTGYTNALTGLTLNAGNGYKTLTVNGDLSGGGQLAMSANITDGTSDRLIVTGNVSGSYQAGFTNDATAATDGSETVQDIIQPGGGTGVFSGIVEYGGYLYGLKQDENGYWDLVGSGRISSSGSASFSTFSAGYLLSYAETTTLSQRLGDLRRGEAPDAPWVRVYGGRFSTGSSPMVSGYGMSYRGIQLGLDRKQETGRGTVYTGGMLGYTSASQNYTSGSGSTDATTLGVYRTFIDPEGRYADLVVKYGWMNSDYKVFDTAFAQVTDDLSTHGPSISLEVGQRLYKDKANKEGWYLEPQAQLSLGRQSGGRFTASNGLAVKVDDYSSVLGRLGIIVGHEVKKGGRPVNAYGKVSYVKEFDGDIGFTLNGSPVKERLGGSWWTYGAGVTARLGSDSNLYLDATRASGGKFKQSWQLNVGLRRQFD
jgi:outer membrane autotransporter protein